MDLKILELDRNIGYGPRGIPSERDQAIETLFEECLRSSQIDLLAKSIRVEHHSVLVVFGERIASLAVRRRDAKLLRIGLIGLALGGWVRAPARC